MTTNLASKAFMILKITLITFAFSKQFALLAQTKAIQPYKFITMAKDTVDAELGTFTVLEDRAQTGKDSIQLSFIRFKSTNPNPSSPIIYLSGGPGGSGIGTARGNRFALFMKLREVADVIAFDQRGTGMSNILADCPYTVEFELSEPLDKTVYTERTTSTMTRCLEFWNEQNINLKAYNTTESAKDLDNLRQMLDTDKISLWGISYGSHLAFEYIRLFEKNLDKVVLASLEGPNETIKLPKNTENFILQIAENAQHNYGAEIKYDNLKEKIIMVHERLKKKPVFSSDTKGNRGINSVGMSNFEVQLAIATFFLKNPEDSKKLPKLYTQMYNGDFSTIARYVTLVKKYIFNKFSPMALAMDMQSGISIERKELVAKQAQNSLLGSSINFLLYEWMAYSGFKQLPDEFREMKTNHVNALLLSGNMDGRTYLNSGIAIAEKFKNGNYVIIENAGHDLYMKSPIIGCLILDFFKDKKLNVNKITLEPTIFD